MIQRIFLFLALLLQVGQICHGEIQDPTHSDLRYSGDYKRSQLDLWLSESKKLYSGYHHGVCISHVFKLIEISN